MELSSFVITGRIIVLDLSIHYYYDIFFKIIYLHTRKYHVFYLSSLYKGHATHLVWNQLTSLFSTTIFLRGIMHIVRTQLKGRSPAYIYLLNCAPLLFFCVQGGGPRKNVLRSYSVRGLSNLSFSVSKKRRIANQRSLEVCTFSIFPGTGTSKS